MRGAFFHATAAAIMAYGYTNLREMPVDKFISTQKGGHSQFLTIIGLWMAFATMSFGLALDIIPSLTAIRGIKRTILMVALPISTIVTSVYWSLLVFLPEMILAARPLPIESPNPDQLVPSFSEPTIVRIPLSTDLALHAVPAISLLVDFFSLEKKYPRWQVVYGGVVLTAIAGVSYASWIEHCAKFNGSFPYPFLTGNPFDVRVMIYAGLTTFALVTFWIMNSLHK